MIARNRSVRSLAIGAALVAALAAPLPEIAREPAFPGDKPSKPKRPIMVTPKLTKKEKKAIKRARQRERELLALTQKHITPAVLRGGAKTRSMAAVLGIDLEPETE